MLEPQVWYRQWLLILSKVASVFQGLSVEGWSVTTGLSLKPGVKHKAESRTRVLQKPHGLIWAMNWDSVIS